VHLLNLPLKNSRAWPSFKIVTLQAPIRTTQDPEYNTFVDDIGEDFTHRDVSLHLLEQIHSLEECITFLFPLNLVRTPSLLSEEPSSARRM
jgi:hypothetical protein